MAKLDENYLDIVRTSLYHSDLSRSNAVAKTEPIKSINPKKDSTYKLDNISNTKSDEEIRISPKSTRERKVSFKDINSGKTKDKHKPRVSTPFKVSNSSSDPFVIVNSDEKACPSLSSDLDLELPNQDKKRISSNSPGFKRKKSAKVLLLQTKLNFDESLDVETEPNDNLVCSKLHNKRGIISKKTKKKRLHKPSGGKGNTVKVSANGSDISTTQIELNGLGFKKTTIKTKYKTSHVSNNKTQINVTSLNNKSDECEITSNNGWWECDAGDFYDDDRVTVENLKFPRFANLFQPTVSEQYSGQSLFNVPQKHFKMSETDHFEWQSKWVITEEPQKEPLEEKINGKVSSTSTPQKPTSKPTNIKKLTSTPQKPPQNEESEADTLSKSFEDSVVISDDNIGENDVESPLLCNELLQNLSPKVIPLQDFSKVVVLPDINQIVHFHGICYIKVLQGKIEILGANLDTNSPEQKVYSPRGTALLYVRNHNKLYSESRIELKTLVSSDLLDDDDTNLCFPAHCVILHCRELKEHFINFIENSISQVIFPQNISTGPRVNFDLKGSWNKTRYSDQWGDALENLPDMFKLAVCGGKGVGKSTFLRYCINFLLGRFKKIRVIDLDPGQSEFHPSGFISVVTVDSIILGPNYTHLQSADRLILSHINIGQNIKHYLNSVKFLLHAASLMETLPTIFNFHGFNVGIGLDISVNQLAMIKPTHLFEFKSRNEKKNYKIDLTSELANKCVKTSVLKFDIFRGNELNYVYVKLRSVAERTEAWSLEARQSRELCLFSYFGKMMSDDVKDLTSPGVNMYSINVSALNITNYEGVKISPLSVNNNLVALCSATMSNGIFSSYGYGLVRGLDLETDTLVLVTPANIETLENVTHLVLGSVTAPPDLIMSTGGAKGHIPYVNVGDLVDFGQLTKRSYIPAKK